MAEDLRVNRTLVVKILEKNGFRVLLASDGQAALSLWGENPEAVDLILMDVQMPVMDGIEATRRIRQAELTRDSYTPIVALTAHAMVGDEQRCLEAGMDAYLSKPIETARLVSTLRRILQRGRCSEGIG